MATLINLHSFKKFFHSSSTGGFFLLVGLEIKRWMVEGDLSSFKKASLPILAAIGSALPPH